MSFLSTVIELILFNGSAVMDPFCTGKNGARRSLRSSIDLSFSAELIDTYNDHDIKIFGPILASFPPHASKCIKMRQNASKCENTYLKSELAHLLLL